MHELSVGNILIWLDKSDWAHYWRSRTRFDRKEVESNYLPSPFQVQGMFGGFIEAIVSGNRARRFGKY